MSGEFSKARLSSPTEMTEVQKAKAEMDYQRRLGHHRAFRDAKKHYERLLAKERKQNAGAN